MACSRPRRQGRRKGQSLHFLQSCAKPVRVFDEYSTYPITSKLWRGISRRPDSDRHARESAHATGARRRSWLVEHVETLNSGRFTARLNPVDSVHRGSRRLMNRSSRLSGARPPGRRAQGVTNLSSVKIARLNVPFPLGSRSKGQRDCPYEQYL